MEIAERYKLFIFDFDGTLADTLEVYFDCFETIFTSFGLESANRVEIESWFGPNEIGILTKRFGQHEQLDQIIEVFLANYEAKHPQLVRENLEIQEFLTYLRRKNKKLAIFTGKGQKTFDFSTSALQMENLFDYVVTGDDVQRPKPDPEGLLKVLAKFKASPAEAIYFGDSNGDILTARNVGMDCAIVKWFCPDKVFSMIPTYEFQNFSQLYEKFSTE